MPTNHDDREFPTGLLVSFLICVTIVTCLSIFLFKLLQDIGAPYYDPTPIPAAYLEALDDDTEFYYDGDELRGRKVCRNDSVVGEARARALKDIHLYDVRWELDENGVEKMWPEGETI